MGRLLRIHVWAERAFGAKLAILYFFPTLERSPQRQPLITFSSSAVFFFLFFSDWVWSQVLYAVMSPSAGVGSREAFVCRGCRRGGAAAAVEEIRKPDSRRALRRSHLAPPACVEKKQKPNPQLCYDGSPGECLRSVAPLHSGCSFTSPPLWDLRQFPGKMTQFDTPSGWFMWIMFPCDHHRRKEMLARVFAHNQWNQGRQKT